MTTLAVLGLMIALVALVCRSLWQARRDKALKKALAAGMAAGVGGSELGGAMSTDNSSNWGGGGDDGGGGGD